MATVNLGRIKPVFRGAFNNSTAYVIDDIVTSGNETFIAIAATQGNATSDASKWTKLAAKGADGTDSGATGYEFASAGGTNTPAWFVTKSATQSISNNTHTQITFDTEAIDTDSAFTSNAFTVPSGKGGVYFLVAQMRIDSGDDFDAGIITLRVNSTNIGASWARPEYYDFHNISMLHNLSAGDVVTVLATQNSGSTKNIGHIDRGPVTFFGGYKLIQ